MKVKRVDSPESYSRGEYEPQDDPPPADYGDADEIIYWYSSGSYCGAGQALIRKGKKYALIDLGHCSCYGPWDDRNVTYRDAPISISAGYLPEVAVFNKPKLFKVEGK